ncbi:MAG: arginine--tRNA ligase [Patescibacteria group bacterium]|jgi:arginyl-tRNA synthetase
MNSLSKIKKHLADKVNVSAGGSFINPADFTYPQNSGFGDLSLACFSLAKEFKKNPAETAKELAEKIKGDNIISEVKTAGPYLNFTLNVSELAKPGLKEIAKEKNKYGANKGGKRKKIMLEYAHPNTHKAFHIGHLRNIITGEAVARIMGVNGFKVIRANYQGDVGLHIAKCLWGINKLTAEYEAATGKPIEEKVKFLGRAYALGSENYEASAEVKSEIIKINKQIYSKDETIKATYEKTRDWSLEYFNNIYKRLGTKFDRLYFESEVFLSGKKIVLENLKKSIFEKSNGAIIFPGEKYGLHSRVFINSEGFPTYEGKDAGLAELQFKEYKPEKIIHIVATEQNEYFKVIIKAIEEIFPKLKGVEIHLPYGWVRLKDGKMSSRLGNVVLGEWLLDEVAKKIAVIAKENKNAGDREEVIRKVSLGAVKYSILKSGINKEIVFDIDESISLSGASGPYVQYAYARIESIFRKAKDLPGKKIKANLENLSHPKEHQIILKLAKYPEIIEKAGANYDPAEVAKYLFELAQAVNDYYHDAPVLKADAKIREARLTLLKAVNQVIKNGLYLLGIETLEEM